MRITRHVFALLVTVAARVDAATLAWSFPACPAEGVKSSTRRARTI